MTEPEPISRDRRTSEGYSEKPEAVRKRRSRDRKRAAKNQEADRAAIDTILHETEPVRVTDAPERFASIPEPIPPSAAQPEAPPVGTPEGEAAQPGSSPPPPAQPVGTTPAEAKIFGQLVVGYFQIGSSLLFKNEPRTGMAFGALCQGIPQVKPDAAPLTPEQAFKALCDGLQACSERVAMKYNLHIPFFDEIAVATSLGVASFGVALEVKARKKDNVAAAKNANVQAQPSQPTQPTNGASMNPEAKAAAQEAATMPVGFAPIPKADISDVDDLGSEAL